MAAGPCSRGSFLGAGPRSCEDERREQLCSMWLLEECRTPGRSALSVALGCQAEAPREAGLWWSSGIGGGGADGCSLLYRVSLMSLSFVPLVSALSLSAANPASQHRRQTLEEWSVGLGAGPEEWGLKQLILHGAYTHPEGGYDVAFLLLAQPVTLGPGLRPLCLPYADHHLPDGEHGWVLGLTQKAGT